MTQKKFLEIYERCAASTEENKEGYAFFLGALIANMSFELTGKLESSELLDKLYAVNCRIIRAEIESR